MVKKKRKKKLKAAKIIGFIFIMLVLAAVLFCYKYVPQVMNLYQDANTKVQSISDNTFSSTETTFIYDDQKNVIDKLFKNKDVIYLNYSEIPQYAKDSFVAVEDKDFFKHGAVSFKGLFRAFYALVKNKGEVTQGGSTITQQLSKNIFLTMDQSFNRKVEEVFISYDLENKYSKEQILEFYINNIYFGNGAYGIEAAAKKYFSKSVKELNLSQIAFLAAIPNSPDYYDPIKNYNNTIDRRNLILDDLKGQDLITSDEYSKAMNEKIVLEPEKYEKQNSVTSYVIDCAAKTLMENRGFVFKYEFKTDKDRKQYNDDYNKLYAECTSEIYKGGYRIYTSIDLNNQKLLQQSVDKNLSVFKDTENGVYSLQGAAATIDNKTGMVVAVVGGRTSGKTDYLNRAFQAYRQPGSTIKPLIVYTPAFQKGYSPSSIITDKYIENGPKNDDGNYYGDIPIRKAVQMSLNTVAYQVFDAVTPKYGLSFLLKMNFDKIVSQDYNLAAGLGGLTYGVTPVQMASGYSALERNGQFINPTCIIEITDSHGESIYKNPQSKVKIYNDDAAYLMTDVLKGTMENEWGTGHSIRLSNSVSAGKTGTTNDQKDGWFCGYTPLYTTAVWVGYDKPKHVNNLYGATYPGHIWNDFMDSISKGVDTGGFVKPDSVVEVYLDKTTGKRVPSDYDGAVKELFSSNNVPSQDANITKDLDTQQANAEILVSQYENTPINTLTDIAKAENLGNQALQTVQALKTGSSRSQLLQRIYARKAMIDNKKVILSTSTQSGTQDGTLNDSGVTSPSSNTNTTVKPTTNTTNSTNQKNQKKR